MDILLALVPMFAWGSIGLVSGRIGGDANQQTLGMTIGAGVLSVIIFILMRPVIMLPVIVVGLLSGLLWSVGQNQQFHAMKFLGVSVGLPISTGLQLIVNTIAGAVFFREWKTNKDFVLGLTALGMLISGAYLTVSFSLSQMGIIISTIGGIFILKEAKTKKEIRFVIYGCLLIIAGGVLLGYMKA